MAESSPESASLRLGDRPLVAIVVVIAATWAGYNAWDEQRHRTLPLDLDGWGHLVQRLQDNDRSFGSLFVAPSLWKGPVVPFVFGLCYYIAPFPTSILVMNVGFFALSAGLLFNAFRRLGATRWVALAAIMLWVFYLPHRVVFGYYFAEPLLALLSSTLFWLAARMLTRPRNGTSFVMGIVAGVLLMARAPFFLVVVGLPFVLWFSLVGRERRMLMFYAIGLLAVCFPWPVRNYIVEREFIPFTTDGGLVLFQGTYVPGDAVQMGELRQLRRFQEIKAGAEGNSAVEQYRYWRSLAKNQILEDPFGQMVLCTRKAIRFWAFLPAHSWIPAWKTAATAILALLLAGIGTARGRRTPLVQLCFLWVCGLWLFHAIIHAELRYNLPVLPNLFLLSALGVQSLVGRWGVAQSFPPRPHFSGHPDCG